jgi:hypothetical protein
MDRLAPDETSPSCRCSAGAVDRRDGDRGEFRARSASSAALLKKRRHQSSRTAVRQSNRAPASRKPSRKGSGWASVDTHKIVRTRPGCAPPASGQTAIALPRAPRRVRRLMGSPRVRDTQARRRGYTCCQSRAKDTVGRRRSALRHHPCRSGRGGRGRFGLRSASA